ncbi:MAG TPA: hypothetical protein VHO06_16260, partial [Polyangia bacterium]|nr:hypothetical protein [Polyangia bacterium]
DGAGGVDAAPACTGLGPPIALQTAGGLTCAAALATRGHRFAVCACDNLTLAAGLRTDAFNSTNSGDNDQVSAAVGTDGALVTLSNAELRAGGAVYVAGSAGVSANEHLQAGASFRSGGPLTMLSSRADLYGDAYVDGELTGSVDVSGTLYVPTTVTVGGNVQAGAVSPGPVSVSAPCDCSDSFVDVAGTIATAHGDNGDAAAGFGPDALTMVSGAAQLTLGCGTYYLDSIVPAAGAIAPITLVVHGRALLAVAGNVILNGGLNVVLDPSAELDLLVGQWFTTSGGTIGAPAAPARFRIWIAGNESLTFDNQPTIAAVVHAPGAVANAAAGLTLSGSLFVKSLILGDDSQVHYDRAILSAGAGCGEPTATAPL